MEQRGEFHWSDTVIIRYVFLTRAWNGYVKEVIDAVTHDFFPGTGLTRKKYYLVK
jgi:hypothetical protein